jgi:uncharacterized protein with HEPN domain
MSEKDVTLIRLMLETIEKIFRYTSDLENSEEFEDDIESFDATIMNFITLGECISKISDAFRDDNPHIEWSKIYAFRNVIAHDYFGILPEEVWEIIKKDLPKLRNDLLELLKN